MPTGLKPSDISPVPSGTRSKSKRIRHDGTKVLTSTLNIEESKTKIAEKKADEMRLSEKRAKKKNFFQIANRKILEELQLKKLQLKQGVAATLNSPPVTLLPVTGAMTPEAHMMSSTQRAALQHAHGLSFGFFITQDSSFGNLIMPVLPRFDTK
uniref:SOSS complex subunit C n=1 Tax=Timema cristinae TaxID=61476 RepID=A0A7R9CC82_TIMCR|nr:unnamed protein product [Timema cristinae]